MGAPFHLLFTFPYALRSNRGAYIILKLQNLTRVMACAFMALENAVKPKVIKLLDTWAQTKIFPESKIFEIRDTLTIMLTNGGVFPAHLASAGPQTGCRPFMAQGPMDVETTYPASQDVYHYRPQENGMQQHYQMGRAHIDRIDAYAANTNMSANFGCNTNAQSDWQRRTSPKIHELDAPLESSGPRILCPKELARLSLLRLKISRRIFGKFCLPCEMFSLLSVLSSRDVSDVIRNLYDARPHVCPRDGRRFKEKRDLEQHLDDLFAKNKIKKDRAGGPHQQRLWFLQVGEWCKAHDVSQVADKTHAASDVIQDKAMAQEERSVVVLNEWGSGLKCCACHELLKKSWDGESDEWVFRGVIFLEMVGDRPSLVHQTCHVAGASALSS